MNCKHTLLLLATFCKLFKGKGFEIVLTSIMNTDPKVYVLVYKVDGQPVDVTAEFSDVDWLRINDR